MCRLNPSAVRRTSWMSLADPFASVVQAECVHSPLAKYFDKCLRSRLPLC